MRLFAVILALALSAGGIWLARLTDPALVNRRERPAPDAQAIAAAGWASTLPGILRDERRLKRAAAPRDFAAWLEIALTRQLYLRNRSLAEGGDGTPVPDAEYRRLLGVLRRIADTAQERRTAAQLTALAGKAPRP